MGAPRPPSWSAPISRLHTILTFIAVGFAALDLQIRGIIKRFQLRVDSFHLS